MTTRLPLVRTYLGYPFTGQNLPHFLGQFGINLFLFNNTKTADPLNGQSHKKILPPPPRTIPGQPLPSIRSMFPRPVACSTVIIHYHVLCIVVIHIVHAHLGKNFQQNPVFSSCSHVVLPRKIVQRRSSRWWWWCQHKRKKMIGMLTSVAPSEDAETQSVGCPSSASSCVTVCIMTFSLLLISGRQSRMWCINICGREPNAKQVQQSKEK